MITTLERLGGRMLNRFVPKVTAAATECACDPGHCWCKNYKLREACCCKSNCVTIVCYCSPEICGPW
jgi:hypothetical protein